MKKFGIILLLLASLLFTVATVQGQTQNPPTPDNPGEGNIVDGVLTNTPREQTTGPDPVEPALQEGEYIVNGVRSSIPPQPSSPAPQPLAPASPSNGQIKDGQLLGPPGDGPEQGPNDDQSALPLDTAAVNLCIPHSTITLNFDEQARPTIFADAVALRYEYRAAGVIFNGPAAKDGGAVLDQTGGFGVSGHSAPNFLAFNTGALLSDGGIPRPPEEILFLGKAITVTVMVGSNSSAGQPITMEAFDQQNNSLGTSSEVLAAALKPLTISANGIARVAISTPAVVFVLDDLSYVPAAYVDVLDFNTGTLNGLFNAATALREEYKNRGIHFVGPAEKDGGAILNQSGGFGVSGHSPPNFLAFNTGALLSDGGIPRPPERINFDHPVSAVQIFAGSNSDAGQTMTLEAFDKSNVSLGSASLTLAPALQPLTIQAPGIAYAVISSPASVFILDDLIFVRQNTYVVDFDEAAQPALFASALALRNQYEECGVHFKGPAEKDGGAVLDESGSFGVSGHSSPNFLAFNSAAPLSDGGVPRGPEDIRLLYPASFVQIYAGSNSGAGSTITMTAYDKNGASLGSSMLTLAAGLQPLSISAHDMITVTVNSPAEVFVLDNLSIVYEPAVADFTGAPVSGTSPVTVNFTNTSTGAFATCAWDFGDGATSNSCTSPVTHTYINGGKYTVKLTVSGLGGSDTMTKTDYINLNYGIYLPLVFR